MNSKKQKVIDFLQNLPDNVYEQYNEAFHLYRQHEAKEFTAERTYNQGYSETNLKNLLYDLQKVYGITDLELLEKAAPSEAEKGIQFVADTPAEKSFEELKEELINAENQYLGINSETSHKDVQAFGARLCSATDAFMKYLDENPQYKILLELQEAVTEAKNEWDLLPKDAPKEVWEPVGEKLDQAKKALSDFNLEKAPESEEFTPAPTSDERTKLRDNFPFLKEEDCPLELKALVTDKINAYEEYVTGHNQLLKHANGEITLTEEKLQELTKSTTEAFELNRDIYDELNYYRANGKVLGNHPIFKSLTLQREVNSMSQDALLSFRDSSSKFFSTKKKDLEKAGTDQLKINKINASIATRTEKLALVNIKLGVKK